MSRRIKMANQNEFKNQLTEKKETKENAPAKQKSPQQYMQVTY